MPLKHRRTQYRKTYCYQELDIYCEKCLLTETLLSGGVRKPNNCSPSERAQSNIKALLKQYQFGSTALNHGQRLVTYTAEKANIHNMHFQSVFRTTVSLLRLCKMKLQDAAGCGKHYHQGCRSLLPSWRISASLFLVY